MELIYGKRSDEGGAICDGYIKTNKATYGPFTTISHPMTASPNRECGSNFIVEVPQNQGFENWFQSAYTTVSVNSITQLEGFSGAQYYNAALFGTRRAFCTTKRPLLG